MQNGVLCESLEVFEKEVVVGFERWSEDESQHLLKVAEQAKNFVERRSRGLKHPVWDFLFTYYNFTPQKLMTWAPFLESDFPELASHEKGVMYRWPKMKARDLRQMVWIRELCDKIQQRAVKVGCHGMHEWAMVYEMTADEVRHQGYQLRMEPSELKRFVDSQSVICTHYDAFRFFTPSAVPLNAYAPSLETRLMLEQGGCLHANMDLYKWSYKLWPWIGSDMVADAFALALEGRVLDMEASPYDLVDLGFAPLCLETEEGRAQYRERQSQLAVKSMALRERLKTRCDAILTRVSCAELDRFRADL